MNDKESSKYLDYGKGHRYDLVVNDLDLDVQYVVMVSNNTIDAYNITFTALGTSAEIHIDYDGTKIDIYNNSLTELQIIFVEDSTIHFIHYITLKFDNTLADLVEFILNILTFSFMLFLSGIIVIIIARKF